MSKVKSPNPAILEKTLHQGGVYMDIRRDQIKGCPWNPRRISSYARDLLKKKIQDVGCVTPLVWNSRSGNIVGGNQRLSILDEIEGSRSYIVGVMAVNIDDKTEREMNVALNNREAQGDFDKDSLLKMFAEGMDMADAGLTKIDLEYEFGELPELAGIFSQEAEGAKEVAESLNQIAAVSPFRAEFRKKQKEDIQKSRDSAQQDGDYYAIVDFGSTSVLADWLRINKFPKGSKCLNFSQIEHLVRKPSAPKKKRATGKRSPMAQTVSPASVGA